MAAVLAVASVTSRSNSSDNSEVTVYGVRNDQKNQLG